MDKDNKDFIDKLNSLKTQLEQEKEASTIKELLSNLYKNILHVLFNKCNVDVNGKPTIVDPDTGRPIITA